MNFPAEKLRAWSAAHGVALSVEQLAQFSTYAAFLVEYNEKVNLTAITDPEEIAAKHFLDSLLLLDAAPPAEGAALIDVGTGAGFPGVPLKLARPDIRLTLLDSLQKRLAFLEALSQRLALPCRTVHARAEDGGRDPSLRERFDLATARAVAALPALCEYCLPFVRVGGCFVAFKARGAQEELAAAGRALATLGGRAEEVRRYTLPDGSERNLVIIRKISQTPSKYPRQPAKMAKSPL